MTDWENKVTTETTNLETNLGSIENLNQINDVITAPTQNEVNSKDLNTDSQQAPNLTELFSENISEETTVTPKDINTSTNGQTYITKESNEDTELTNDEWMINGPTFQVDTTQQIQKDNISDEINQQIQTNNQNISGKIQQSWENDAKEKLLQLIKIHESNAQKKWFTLWILSGVALTACILVLTIVFAKDQIINILNLWVENNVPLTANVLHLENENVSSVENDVSDVEIENNSDTEIFNNENTSTENTNNEATNITLNETENNLPETNNYNTEEINNEIIIKDEINNNENTPTNTSENALENENINETIENNDLDNTLLNEATTELNKTEENIEEHIESEDISLDQNKPDLNNIKYKITRVSSTWEANRVLPIHCWNDIFCNNTNQTFTPCEKFRLNENMSDDANRIWNTWTCRYKDLSELVHIDFE